MNHLYSTDKLFSPSFSFEDAHNMLDLSRLILEKNRKKYANYRFMSLRTKALSKSSSKECRCNEAALSRSQRWSREPRNEGLFPICCINLKLLQAE